MDTILTPTGINMTELLTYINPVMELEEKHENFTSISIDKMKRSHTPMRVCKKSDFESRGYFSDS